MLDPVSSRLGWWKHLSRVAVLLALILLACSAPPARAGMEAFGEIIISTRSEPHGQSSHGYFEFVIAVKNTSTQRSHRVRLTIPGHSYSSGGDLRSISREVEVGPGATELVSLWQPARPTMNGNGLGITIDGRDQSNSLGVTVATSSYVPVSGHHRGMPMVKMVSPRGGGPEALILVSQGAKKVFELPAGRAAEVKPGRPPRLGPGDPVEPEPVIEEPIFIPEKGVIPVPAFGQLAQADDPITSWSNRSWLGYGRYDAIVITRVEMDSLVRGPADTQGVRTALTQYTEAGGVLIIMGAGEAALPANWKRQHEEIVGGSYYRAGFGVCIQTEQRESQKWPPVLWQTMNTAWQETSRPFLTSPNLSTANQALPIISEQGVPVFGLMLLMLLFAVVIGPVNLWLLSHWNRRIWLLWTVPAISLVTCLAVFGFMIFAEGWQGRASVVGFTLLDEKEQRATTLGRTAYYSPLTPGSGLTFSAQTEVTVLGLDGSDTSTYTIEWTREQQFKSGWVSARVPAHFQVRKCESRRERLTFNPETLTVTNGLGVDIRQVHLANANGKIYKAGPIAAGQQAKLEPSGERPVSEKASNPWRQLYLHTEWAKLPDPPTSEPSRLLVRNSYLAITESSAFLEQGLNGAGCQPNASVVLGLMGDP